MTRVFDGASETTVRLAGPESGGQVEISDARLMFSGHYVRSGNDLHITSGTETIVVARYFDGEQRATLVSPEGATLGGDVVDRLAGPRFPGQYAQAGGGGVGQDPIGQVENLTGTATATRIDGTLVSLNVGDHVFRQDIVQTGPNSSLSITFADRTIFSMQDDARMVLDQFAYAPGGSGNSLLFNLVQGAFAFIAGQVAPSGNMRVETPVATAGIRGTTGVMHIVANNGATIFTLTNDPDGRLGAYGVFNKASGTLIRFLTGAGESVLVRNALGEASDINKTLDQISTEQFVLGQAFSAFTLLQGRQQRGEDPVNPLPPEQQPSPPQPPGTRRGAVEGQTQQATAPLSEERKLVELLPEVTEQDKWGGGDTNSTSPFLPTTLRIAGSISTTNLEDSTRFNVDLLQGATGGGPLLVTNVQGLVPGVTLQGTSLVVDPTDPAFQSLAVGQERVITVTYTIVGGSGATLPQSASITIVGVNDVPIVAASSAVVAENDVATGQIVGSDADDGETATLTYAVVGATPAGFTLQTDGTWSFDAANYDRLAAGQTLIFQVAIAATDAQGTTSEPAEFTIKLTGLNDKAVVDDGDVTGHVTEADHPYGVLTETGTIAFTDADLTDTHTVSVAAIGNTLGTLAAVVTQDSTGGVAGKVTWTYTVTAADVEYLGEADRLIEKFQITLDDGNGGIVERTVEIKIIGTDDAPTFGGDRDGEVSEDAYLTTSGVLTVSDPDAGQSAFTPASGTSDFGSYTISADGAWHYLLDNSDPAVQALKGGQTATDVFTVASVDGATENVTITITGSNDTAVIGLPDSTHVTEDQHVVDGRLSVTGTIPISDIDHDEARFKTTVAPLPGAIGLLILAASGTYTYAIENDAIQFLGAAQTHTDRFRIESIDGTTTIVSFVITGANDVATIGAPTVNHVTEDVDVKYGHTLQAKGSIAVSDIDQGESAFQSQVQGANGNIGTLQLAADGAYTYEVSNGDVQYLSAGETRIDTFTIKSVDGTVKVVDFTIHGTDDNASFFYGVPVGSGNVAYKDLQNQNPFYSAFDVLVSGNNSVNSSQYGFGIDGGNDIGPGDTIRFSFVLNATADGGSDGTFGVTRFSQWISDVRGEDHHHHGETAKFDVHIVGLDGDAISDFKVFVYNSSGYLVKTYTGGSDIQVKEDWSYTIQSADPFQSVEVSYDSGQPFKLGALSVDAVVDSAIYDSQTLIQSGLTPITGGGGDDTLVVTSVPFPAVDGGYGHDTLRLDNNLDLDLTALSQNAITSIETIDLGAGENDLKLSLADVLDLSETVNIALLSAADDAGVAVSGTSNVLVAGNDGDMVELVAASAQDPAGSWQQVAGGPVTIGAEAYSVYNFVSGSQIIASVAVDTDVAVQANAAA